jgi:hypothetical protein
MGLLIALVVLGSAAAAIYVSATSRGTGSTPVTPVDLSDPGTAQAALSFDPFDAGAMTAMAGLGRAGAAVGMGGGPSAGTSDDTGGGSGTSVGAESPPADEPAAETPPGEEPSEAEAEAGAETPTDEASTGEADAGEEATADTNQPKVDSGTTPAPKVEPKMKFGIGAAIGGAAAAAGAGGAAVGIAMGGQSTAVVRSPSAP